MRSIMRLMAAVSVACWASVALAGGDWNDSGISWMKHDEAVAAAKKEGKPICVVLYTEWCPHCTNYSKVFHDPKVVEKSKSFAMVRLDKDQNAELSKKYSPDGEYIPRTYFLSPSGELDPELTAGREQYKYFYSESDPASILAGMDRALAKFKK